MAAMARLYQRGAVYYCDCYEQGRRVRKAISRDRKSAELWLAERILKISGRRNCSTTWRDVYDHFSSHYSPLRHSPATQASVRVSWSHLSQTFSQIAIADTNAELIELYQGNRRFAGASVRTVNIEVGFLRQLGAYAVKMSFAEGNPVSKTISLPGASQRVRWLSANEIARVLEFCDSDLRMIVKFAIATGCRRDEIRKLRWRDVQFAQNLIVIENPKNRCRRSVPLNESAAGVLRGVVRRLGVEHVFVNPQTGEPWSASYLTHGFAKAARRAGIADAHFHDLRHTAASLLAQAGVEINQIREILGHKDLRMTLRYAHLAPKSTFVAMRQLDSVFEGLRAIKFC